MTGLWKDKARQVSSNCHRPRHSARPAQYDPHATSALLDADASLLVAVAASSSPPEMQVHAEQNSLLRKPGPKHRPDRYNHTSLSCHGAVAHPEFVAGLAWTGPTAWLPPVVVSFRLGFPALSNALRHVVFKLERCLQWMIESTRYVLGAGEFKSNCLRIKTPCRRYRGSKAPVLQTSLAAGTEAFPALLIRIVWRLATRATKRSSMTCCGTQSVRLQQLGLKRIGLPLRSSLF